MERHLYHGSEAVIPSPAYGKGNPHSDYGRGFYCTTSKQLAGEWAVRKHDFGYVNEYLLRDDRFAILDLTKPPYDNVLHWLALLMANRRITEDLAAFYPRELAYLKEHYLVDVAQYDAVIGYRADDAYFRFPDSFIRSELTLESLQEIYRAGDLGKQYAVMSPRAFNNLHFAGYHEVSAQARRDYYHRVAEAGKQHQALLAQDRYARGTRMIDLVRDR